MALVAAGCSGAGRHGTTSAPQPLEFAGTTRNISPDFLGVNGEGISTDLLSQAWRDPDFTSEVASLRPGNIRIFGGTSAELWDWSLGRFVKSGPSGSGYLAGQPTPPIHLQDIAAVVRGSGASGLFDLNLVSSTLSDQLTMLREAQAAGIPVRRVELGNELWSPQYAGQFPSGEAYAMIANRWISALHRAFPGVLVAVDVDNPNKATDARGRDWNAQLFSVIREADAASMHAYIHTTATLPQAVVAAADDVWSSSVQPILASIPVTVPVWLTEWNYAAGDPNRTLTWAQAIGDAHLALRLFGEPRIRLADFHAMAGRNGSPYAAILVAASGDKAAGSLTYRLSASGAVLQLLLDALDGCNAVKPVSVGITPHVAAASSFTGLACVAPERQRLVLVNSAGGPQVVDLRQIVPGTSARVVALTADQQSTSTATPSRASEYIAMDRVAVPGWSIVLVSA